MKSYLDCIPCVVRQALEAARFVSDDPSVHERVLREVLCTAAEMDLSTPPPVIAWYIQRRIRQLTGSSDPYRNVKDTCNAYALALLPGMRQMVRQSDDPLETALRLAIIGNVIDFAPSAQVDEACVSTAIRDALRVALPSKVIDDFRSAVTEAQDILYLADNAGEIVFDRLLIEQMAREEVTVVVKGSPVINDATMSDAQAVGLTELVRVIDNGTDAPGTMLDACSEGFRRRFEEADLVIAKGQANYETLSEVEQNIFFLLKAKCPVIARDTGWNVGDLVVEHRRPVGASST